MLSFPFVGICAGVYKDGEGAESLPESDEDIRSLRTFDVLFKK